MCFSRSENLQKPVVRMFSSDSTVLFDEFEEGYHKFSRAYFGDAGFVPDLFSDWA